MFTYGASMSSRFVQAGLVVVLAAVWPAVCIAQSQSPRAPGSEARAPQVDEPVATPTNLRDCYLRIAMTKTNPDAMYLARQVCDQLFKKLDPASLAIYDARTQKCTEWFFDADGRYDVGDMYCAFEPRGENKYVLACEAKDARSRRFAYAELVKNDRRYDKVKTAGFDLGVLFTGMASCVEYKSQQPGVKSE